ncbi:MAG: hypothetical protein J0L56_01715 [Chitinophagales bacterium]|nr:hypothetical protein [Chitinophagales bacterium]
MNIDSFHITYNARHLRPEDIAKSFVFNPDYEELLQGNHTVLLGARGCGKTTLMKMLTLPAIYAWGHDNAQKIKDNLGFYTVYISTDIYWNAQKDAYNKQLYIFPKYAEQVSKVAVTTNVLFALCQTFEDILKYRVVNAKQKDEIGLCRELIELWSLPATIPSLGMVKEALIQRTDYLNRHIQRTVFNCKSDDDVKIEDAYFELDYDTSALNAIIKFERIFSLDSRSMWALCFDELELAPEWLQERLFNSLRSRNQKLLFKLSASPIVSIPNDMIASSGNDFKLIKMWPHKLNNEYVKFVETLVKSVLYNKYGQDVDPELLFGNNPVLNKERNSYEEEGAIWNEVKILAQTDKELRDLLIVNDIDPSNPVVSESNSQKMDTVLRKIKPIVYFRNYYGQVDKTGKRKARSRKAHTLFFGKEVLYKICDGNPRWLIGIINEMLRRVNGSSKIERISDAKQAAVYEDIAEQFFEVVKAIPDAIISRKTGVVALYGVLQEIGDYFFDEIVIGKFQRDPHSTFEIDRDIAEDMIKILEKAVYQGAIVLLNPSENAFDFEMKRKIFKLSYLFSPKFKTPLRKYSTIALSRVLSGKETITYHQSKIDFKN